MKCILTRTILEIENRHVAIRLNNRNRQITNNTKIISYLYIKYVYKIYKIIPSAQTSPTYKNRDASSHR